MFEEFRPVSNAGSANVRWFHELVDIESTVDGGALGWFPAEGEHPWRAVAIPGQWCPVVER